MIRLIPADEAERAPAWSVTQWLNVQNDPSLEDLAGRVVVLHAFQMLCPGCVAHGLPQAQRIRAAFDEADVAVVGLHSVFEHHAAMTPVALAAFVHEYRLRFPVAVDAPQPGIAAPTTMQAYRMRGTPTLILIDRRARLRLHAFGRLDDVAVGAAIATLAAEAPVGDAVGAPSRSASAPACDDQGCRLP